MGESERLGVDVEQAQSTGAMVVVCRHTGRIVAEAIGVYVRRLRLELSGELADVVLSKEIANQRISFLARKTEQAGEPLAEPAITCQQRLADRGHVEGVIRKRMPSGSDGRAFPQKSSMFIVRRGGDCRLDRAGQLEEVASRLREGARSGRPAQSQAVDPSRT